MEHIPNSFYTTAGILIITNLSVIGTVVWAMGKFVYAAGKFVAKTEAGIKDAKDTGVRAHKRLDEHERVYHA